MMKHHEIIIQSPRDIATSGAPLILQRSDEDFLDAVLEQFRSESGRKALRQDKVSDTDDSGVRKLFQPIQRRFYVAMVEAICEQPGIPRLDPAKVDAAGMVLRRLGKETINGTQTYEGWMRAGGKLRGWIPLGNVGGEDVDPAPSQRLAARATGSAQIDRALAPIFALREDAILSEHVIPMFVAPPDICSDAQQTMYFGLVLTSSSELAESPPASPYADFGPGSPKFRSHLVDYLQGGKVDFPLSGEIITPDWFNVFELGDITAIEGLSTNVKTVAKQISGDPTVIADNNLLVVVEAVRNFILLLRQLSVEFDAFGNSPESIALFGQLKSITLQLMPSPDGWSRATTADLFLKQAAKVLLERDDLAPKPEMPLSWPSLNATGQELGLINALWAAMDSRFRSMQGKSGRFDEPGAQYALRTFVRIKPEGACPAKIHWTENYTEPFVIAPWYEGAGAPPVQIPLPDLSDKNLLKSLKPNIAFVVPEALQGLLGNKLKDILKGEKNKTSSGGIGWLCSFSIPIITICAFIVLNIFLSLFDLFFQWMLFFKICIPYPKKL